MWDGGSWLAVGCQCLSLKEEVMRGFASAFGEPFRSIVNSELGEA